MGDVWWRVNIFLWFLSHSRRFWHSNSHLLYQSLCFLPYTLLFTRRPGHRRGKSPFVRYTEGGWCGQFVTVAQKKYASVSKAIEVLGENMRPWSKTSYSHLFLTEHEESRTTNAVSWRARGGIKPGSVTVRKCCNVETFFVRVVGDPSTEELPEGKNFTP